MSIKSCLHLGSSPEIHNLAKKFDLEPSVAQAKIGTWLEKNNTTAIPSEQLLAEYMGVEINQTPKFGEKAELAGHIKRKLRINRKYNAFERDENAIIVADLFTSVVNQEVIDRLEAGEPLTRKEIINELKPTGIFTRVMDILRYGIENPDAFYWSETEIANAKKLLDNFFDIADLSSKYVAEREGVLINMSRNKAMDVSESEDSHPDTAESVEEELDDIFTKEEELPEAWTVKHQYLSSKNSLSREVRSVLSNIQKVGFDGNVERNSLLFPRKVDPDLAHAILIDKLRYMTEDKDLIPMLLELSETRKWVSPIIELLEQDLSLKSKFYNDFRKDFTALRVVKRRVKDNGVFTFETIDINKPRGISYLYQEWNDNYTSGTLLSGLSIYNTNGTVNRENVDKVNAIANKLAKAYKKESDKYDFAKSSEWTSLNIGEISELLRAIGISESNELIERALNTNPYGENSKLKYYHPIDRILRDIQAMTHTTNAKNIGLDSQGKEEPVNWLKEFSNTYRHLSEIFAEVTEDAIESSVFENGKNYYSHQVPSYLNKYLKKFKNASPEKFAEFIQKEFGLYHQFFDFVNNQYRDGWIKDLAENPADRQLLETHTMLNFNKVNYSDLSELEYTIAMIQEFLSTGNDSTAFYHIPILSDSPAGVFIKYKRYDSGKNSIIPLKDGVNQSYKLFLTDRFVTVAKLEYDRIKLVRNRKEAIGKNSVLKPIDNLDKNGDKFTLFPAMNDRMDDIDRLANSKKAEDAVELDKLFAEIIQTSMDNAFGEAMNRWDDIGLFESIEDSEILKNFGTTRDNVESPLENYFWNSAYATSQIIQMTNGDMAMYKNVEDFQKRNKQIYAPGNRLDSSSKYGKKSLKFVTLEDNHLTSESLLNYQEVFRKLGMSGKEIGNILSSYYNEDGTTSGINQTDGQGYGNLYSFRAIEDMQGKWNEEREAAFNKLIDHANGKDVNFTAKDFDTLMAMEAIKPFVYTLRAVKSGFKDDLGNDILIKTPTQYKNSMYMLTVAGLMSRSPKVVAFNNFMNKHNIDAIQFASAVKVGAQGAVNVNSLNDVATIENVLEKSTGLGDRYYSPELQELTVQDIPIEDFSIQQPNSDKIRDKHNLFGSQIRKLAVSDMPDTPDFRVNVNGKNYTKKEFLELYNNLLVENILDDFLALKEVFEDNKKIEEILLQEIRGNKRYDSDMEMAVTLDKNGEFPIPLYDPIMSNKIQQLLSSVVKSRITKQKIKGGSVVQLSNYGFDDSLSVRFSDKNGNVLKTQKEWLNSNKGKTKEDYKQYLELNLKGIAYFEAYMPSYSQLFFEEFMDPKTGAINPNDIPKELRKVLGYRIPTEDKYSMIPIYIKGFLPASAGAAIMLPPDITSITGSDFDIDKMYIMLPEFNVKKYDYAKARIDYNRLFGASDALMNSIFEDIDDIQGEDLFKEFFNQNKDKYEYHTPRLEKVEYKDSRGPEGNSVRARNNILIDMIWGVLTNEDTAPRMLNPQNFDIQKRVASFILILENVDYNTLVEYFGDNPYSKMYNLPLNELQEIASQFAKKLNILSPITQTYLHKQNMTAAQLIGIAANHNASHAMMQQTNIAFSNNMTFTLNGLKLASLHSVLNYMGQHISRNTATYLASSVDAVKDPVLDKLNINTFTADMVFTLSRLGHTPLTIGLLFKQPAVNELISYYENNRLTGLSKAQLITNFILRYAKEHGILMTKYKDTNLTDNLMAFNIGDKSKSKEFYTNQVAVLNKFVLIFNASTVVGDLTAATRADTAGGGAGPTFAATETKQNKLKDFLRKNVFAQVPTLVNGHILSPDIKLDGSTKFREVQEPPKLKDKPVDINAKFEKDLVKANYADGIIGYGAKNTSTDKYVKAFGGTRKSFSPGETIMLSVNGLNRENQAENIQLTKQDIDKAIDSGVAHFIADNLQIANSRHNKSGEGEISKYLISKGFVYSEIDGVGLYTNPNKIDRNLSPIKELYKGKLIYAQSGTGKTTIADNVNIIDGDFLFGLILDVDPSLVSAAMRLLSLTLYKEAIDEYIRRAKELTKSGKTVVTPNAMLLPYADVIIANESAELSNSRTTASDRTNHFSNVEYHQKNLDNIKLMQLRNPGKEFHYLKDGEFLSNVLLTDPSFNVQDKRIKDNSLNDLIEDFLDEFGITYLDKGYKGEGNLFDILNKIVYAKDPSELPESAGEAIAYMMQYSPQLKPIIADMMIEDELFTREQLYSESGDIRKDYKSVDKSKYIKIAGKLIGEELKKLYDLRNGKSEPSFIKKIWDVVVEFFNMMTPQKVDILNRLSEYSKLVANNVLVNNPAFIKKSILKPGDEKAGKVKRVNFDDAVDENPYERDILQKLNNVGMNLTGSTAISHQALVMRPVENPLHDMDFVAVGHTSKESVDKVVNELFEHIQHYRTITKEGKESWTETYITMTVPFTTEPSPTAAGYHIIRHAETGEVLGNYFNNDLTITDSRVNGKMLDFFINDNNRRPTIEHTHNGFKYLLSDYRDAFAKKLEYARLKDIWDYNRLIDNKFVPHKLRKNQKEDYKKALRQQLRSSNLPMLQAFHTLGLQSIEEFVKDKFPHFRKDFRFIMDALRDLTFRESLSEKTMNKIYEDLTTYIMSSTEFFAGNNLEQYAENYQYYMELFPKDFRKLQSSDEFKNNAFVQALRVQPPNKQYPFTTIVMRNVGGLSKNQRQNMREHWTDLLNGSEEAKKLGFDLIKYSYMRNGFSFAPDSFTHLISTEMKTMIPGYVETLERVLKEDDSDSTQTKYDDFIRMFLLNNTNIRELVPLIDKETGMSIEKDGVITEEFSISIPSQSSDRFVEVPPGIQQFKIRDDNKVVEFKPFVVFKSSKGEVVYELVDSTDRKAYYQIVQPLGYLNHHKQYFFGATIESIGSSAPRIEPQQPEIDGDRYTLPEFAPDMNEQALGMQEMIAEYNDLVEAELAGAEVQYTFTEGGFMDPKDVKKQDAPKEETKKPDGLSVNPYDFDPDMMYNLEDEVEALMREIRAYGRDGNYRRFIKPAEIDRIVRKFNTTHPKRGEFIASTVKGYHQQDDFIFWRILIKPRTKLNSLEASHLEHNANLNLKIRDILAKHGIKIGALTELEKRLKIAGVMDTSQAKEAVDGIIELIRLAEGIRGEKALPEEFAHFVIEAMGDDPLVTRLLTMLNQNGLVEEVLGSEFLKYNEVYEGNTLRLAKEAAGKLLAKHLLQNELMPTKPWKSLLLRIINKLKSIFNGLLGNDISKARYQLDNEFNKIAKGIMDGTLESIINVLNIVNTPDTVKLFNLGEKINRDRELLKKMIETETKLFYIQEKKLNKSNDLNELKNLIEDLNRRMERNDKLQELAGIQLYMDNVVTKLAELNKSVKEIYQSKDSVKDINAVSAKLLEANDFYHAYVGILQEVNDQLNEDELNSGTRFDAKVKAQVRETLDVASQIKTAYDSLSIEMFSNFLEPFLGLGVKDAYFKKTGLNLLIRDIIVETGQDIGMASRWLASMSRINDLPSLLIDAVVKKQRTDARVASIDIAKKMLAAHLKLEKAGVKNTDFMFLRDASGNVTGYYIDEIDIPSYYEALHKYRQELEKNYPGDDNFYVRSVKLDDWYKDNRELVDGRLVPKKSKYPSKQFNSLNAAQREYYDTFMEVKTQLDEMLPPEITTKNRAVMMRRDFLERLAKSGSLKEGASQLVDNLKDTFMRRVDDTDFGDASIVNAVTNFQGNEVNTLPVYYIRPLEDMSSLSLDATSTLIAYATMANDYHHMNKVISALELGREVLRKRAVNETQGGKPKMEKIDHMGRTITSKLSKRGNEPLIMLRLNDYFSMQVYGRYIKDLGDVPFTKVKISKLADVINRWASLSSTALSFFVGSTNLLTGIALTNIDAMTGEHFGAKDLSKADRLYFANLPDLLGEIGSRVKTSKLSLFVELFNTSQELENKLKYSNMDRKNWLSKMMSMETLYFMSTSGEHWMHTRVALAMANKFKMKSPSGEVVGLFDALEVVHIDPKNKSLGAKLEVKKGYTKEDGSSFSTEDLNQLVNKSSHVNQLLHGVYNRADREAIHALAQGRLVMMFRKWMYTALTRRYGKEQYNVELDQMTEGYYRTVGNFLKQVAKDLKRGLFIIGSRFSELEGYLKANMIRALVDAGLILLVASLLTFIDWDGDDDDRKKRSWLTNALEYQLRRKQTELLSLAPLPWGVPQEGRRILQSPAAGMTIVSNLVELVTFWEWGDPVKRGRYKGKPKIVKTLGDITPLNKTIYGIFHPEERIMFYKRDMQ